MIQLLSVSSLLVMEFGGMFFLMLGRLPGPERELKRKPILDLQWGADLSRTIKTGTVPKARANVVLPTQRAEV